MEGIAIWLPSANYPMTFLRLLRSVPLPVFLGLGWESGQEMKSFGDYIDSVHKRLIPYKHWFLQTIAVDPQFQGKGYAGKLLGPMLTRMDEECLPCYLETIDEANVSLYEHFGFEVVDKSEVPNTNLTNWAMVRRAPQDAQSSTKVWVTLVRTGKYRSRIICLMKSIGYNTPDKMRQLIKEIITRYKLSDDILEVGWLIDNDKSTISYWYPAPRLCWIKVCIIGEEVTIVPPRMIMRWYGES